MIYVAGEKRKRKKADDLTVYRELKESSIIVVNPPVIDITLVNKLPELLGQLKTFYDELNSHRRSNVYIACFMGRNLSHIQDLYYNDPNTTGDFIKAVHCYVPKQGFSKTYIYFLIKLFKTVERFNKLQYVSMSISKIQHNFKFLSRMIEQEADFWRQ